MNHNVAWILIIKPCCRKLLRTRQLYQKLGAFHGKRQKTPKNEVSAVLCPQQNDTYNILFVLRGNLGFLGIATSKFGLRIFDIESTRCRENKSRYNEQAQIMISDVQSEC